MQNKKNAIHGEQVGYFFILFWRSLAESATPISHVLSWSQVSTIQSFQLCFVLVFFFLNSLSTINHYLFTVNIKSYSFITVSLFLFGHFPAQFFLTAMPITNQTRNTNSRNQKKQKPISETDPMYSINPSTRSKSTIFSLLHTPFSPTNPTAQIFSKKKKKKFTSFRGLGCKAATSQQVSLPSAIIRTSADWESSKVKKKKKNKTLNFVGGDSSIIDNNLSSSCLAAPTDVWCGPGIGLTTDAASVDFLVSTRRPLSARGRGDIEKSTPREVLIIYGK